MSYVFTEYVRCLEPGQPADPDLFDAAWDKLRGALAAELKERSLWLTSPTCLGIYGAASWSDPDALDELLTDCYAFIFLSRLPGLKAQMRVKPNVEGLVFLSLRNFLHDTQKRHDPLGFGVFRVLQTAVRQLIAGGTLHVLAGNARVGNDTVLSFRPAGDRANTADGALAEHVGRWNDDLLPDLVTARGKDRDQVEARLATHVARLPDQGVETFRFKDLIDPLKSDVRARWNLIWGQSEGETAVEDGDQDFVTIVRQVRPDSGFEERESFEKLLACVAEGLERSAEAAPTRAYLETLWAFLRAHAAECPAAAGDPAAPGAAQLPSQRKIAQLLNIPRGRLPGLLATLGGLVEDCQAAISGKPRLSNDCGNRSPVGCFPARRRGEVR